MADSLVGPLQFNAIDTELKTERSHTGSDALRRARPARVKPAEDAGRVDSFRSNTVDAELDAARSYARLDDAARQRRERARSAAGGPEIEDLYMRLCTLACMEKARAEKAQLPAPVQFNTIDVELETLRSYARFDALTRAQQKEVREARSALPESVQFNTAVDTEIETVRSYARFDALTRAHQKEVRAARSALPESVQLNTAVDTEIETVRSYARFDALTRAQQKEARAARSALPESVQLNTAVDTNLRINPPYTPSHKRRDEGPGLPEHVQFNTGVDVEFDHALSHARGHECTPERLERMREERTRLPENVQFNTAVDATLAVNSPYTPPHKRRAESPGLPESVQFNTAVDTEIETVRSYARFDALARAQYEDARAARRALPESVQLNIAVDAALAVNPPYTPPHKQHDEGPGLPEFVQFNTAVDTEIETVRSYARFDALARAQYEDARAARRALPESVQLNTAVDAALAVNPPYTPPHKQRDEGPGLPESIQFNAAVNTEFNYVQSFTQECTPEKLEKARKERNSLPESVQFNTAVNIEAETVRSYARFDALARAQYEDARAARRALPETVQLNTAVDAALAINPPYTPPHKARDEGPGLPESIQFNAAVNTEFNYVRSFTQECTPEKLEKARKERNSLPESVQFNTAVNIEAETVRSYARFDALARAQYEDARAARRALPESVQLNTAVDAALAVNPPYTPPHKQHDEGPGLPESVQFNTAVDTEIETVRSYARFDALAQAHKEDARAARRALPEFVQLNTAVDAALAVNPPYTPPHKQHDEAPGLPESVQFNTAVDTEIETVRSYARFDALARAQYEDARAARRALPESVQLNTAVDAALAVNPPYTPPHKQRDEGPGLPESVRFNTGVNTEFNYVRSFTQECTPEKLEKARKERNSLPESVQFNTGVNVESKTVQSYARFDALARTQMDAARAARRALPESVQLNTAVDTALAVNPPYTPPHKQHDEGPGLPESVQFNTAVNTEFNYVRSYTQECTPEKLEKARKDRNSLPESVQFNTAVDTEIETVRSYARFDALAQAHKEDARAARRALPESVQLNTAVDAALAVNPPYTPPHKQHDEAPGLPESVQFNTAVDTEIETVRSYARFDALARAQYEDARAARRALPESVQLNTAVDTALAVNPPYTPPHKARDEGPGLPESIQFNAAVNTEFNYVRSFTQECTPEKLEKARKERNSLPESVQFNTAVNIEAETVRSYARFDALARAQYEDARAARRALPESVQLNTAVDAALAVNPPYTPPHKARDEAPGLPEHVQFNTGVDVEFDRALPHARGHECTPERLERMRKERNSLPETVQFNTAVNIEAETVRSYARFDALARAQAENARDARNSLPETVQFNTAVNIEAETVRSYARFDALARAQAENARDARSSLPETVQFNTAVDTEIETVRSYARFDALVQRRQAESQNQIPVESVQFNTAVDTEIETVRSYARFDALVQKNRENAGVPGPQQGVQFNTVDVTFDPVPSYGPATPSEKLANARRARSALPESIQFNAVDTGLDVIPSHKLQGARAQLKNAREERGSLPETVQFNTVDIDLEAGPSPARFDTVVRLRKENTAEARVSHAARLAEDRRPPDGILERPAKVQLAELWDFYNQFTPQPQREAMSEHRTLVTTRELLTNLEAEHLNVVSRRPEINPGKFWPRPERERTPKGDVPTPGDPFLPSPPFTKLERDEQQRVALDSANQVLHRRVAVLDGYAEARRKREFAERLWSRYLLRLSDQEARWDWYHYVSGFILDQNLAYDRYIEASDRIAEDRLAIRQADRLERIQDLGRRCDYIKAADKADALREESVKKTVDHREFLDDGHYARALDRRADLRELPPKYYFDHVFHDEVYCGALADKDDRARFFKERDKKQALHAAECVVAIQQKTDARLDNTEFLHLRGEDRRTINAETPEPPPPRSGDAQTARDDNNGAGAADIQRRRDARLEFSRFVYERRAGDDAFFDYVRDRHDFYQGLERKRHADFGQEMRDRVRETAEAEAAEHRVLAALQAGRIMSAEIEENLGRRAAEERTALEDSAQRRAEAKPDIGARSAKRRAQPKLPDLAAEARAQEEDAAKRETWKPEEQPPVELGGYTPVHEDWRFRRLNAAQHRIEETQRREVQAVDEARNAAENGVFDPRARRGLIVSVAG